MNLSTGFDNDDEFLGMSWKWWQQIIIFIESKLQGLSGLCA
jgi:hypothetical protein